MAAKNMWLGLGCSALALSMGLVDRATADVLVLDSNVPGVKRGTQLPDNARLRVPAGKSVMIMRPSGETQDVGGPYDRLVRELSRGETIGETFRRMKTQLEKEAVGGSIGATRGVTK
jgi:hypothetical protein